MKGLLALQYDVAEWESNGPYSLDSNYSLPNSFKMFFYFTPRFDEIIFYYCPSCFHCLIEFKWMWFPKWLHSGIKCETLSVPRPVSHAATLILLLWGEV